MTSYEVMWYVVTNQQWTDMVKITIQLSMSVDYKE